VPAEQTVSIIDDDAGVRDSLKVLLESNGYEVDDYESAEAFLEERQPRDVGCLLLDVRMPGMDGLSLQEMLTARRESPPIILITGHGDIAMAVRAMKAGAVDFLEKPFNHEDLLAAVRRALESKNSGGRRNDDYALEAVVRLESLTAREMDVVRHLLAGRANKQIAYELGISPRTVEIYRARAMQKTEVGSLAELVRLALAAEIPCC
jgi:two-component system response regulator FixJ